MLKGTAAQTVKIEQNVLCHSSCYGKLLDLSVHDGYRRNANPFIYLQELLLDFYIIDILLHLLCSILLHLPRKLIVLVIQSAVDFF